MLPASVLAIGSLIAGRPPRSHLHARADLPRAAPPCCCAAPTAEPPEEQPGKLQGGDQPRELLTTLQTTSQRSRTGASTGAVQLARYAPNPRGRGGGARMPPRSTTKRQKIIALFRGAQEAIGRDDLLKARVLLRHCLEIDQADSHSWLALARLEAGAGDVRLARQLFVRGRRACPGNVHLPHAQAVLEGKLGMHGRARLRFAQAARLEPANAYVCHAWGLMEEQVPLTLTLTAPTLALALALALTLPLAVAVALALALALALTPDPNPSPNP